MTNIIYELEVGAQYGTSAIILRMLQVYDLLALDHLILFEIYYE